MMSTNRREHELEHGKKLADHGAEDIWNWSSPAGQRRADRRARYLVNTGKISLNDKVLEIGCGTGLFTEKIFEMTGAVPVGTDISEELLSMARQKFPKGRFMNADAMALPFPNSEFDVVCGSSILHHLDFDKSLVEIFRVLKKGGRAVFAEPNMLNPQIFIQKNIPFIKKMLGDSPDETAVVRWSFAKRMQKIGFTKVHIFPYDFLHPATPKSLIHAVEGVGKVVERIPLLREIAGSVIIYGEK